MDKWRPFLGASFEIGVLNCRVLENPYWGMRPSPSRGENYCILPGYAISTSLGVSLSCVTCSMFKIAFLGFWLVHKECCLIGWSKGFLMDVVLYRNLLVLDAVLRVLFGGPFDLGFKVFLLSPLSLSRSPLFPHRDTSFFTKPYFYNTFYK